MPHLRNPSDFYMIRVYTDETKHSVKESSNKMEVMMRNTGIIDSKEGDTTWLFKLQGGIQRKQEESKQRKSEPDEEKKELSLIMPPVTPGGEPEGEEKKDNESDEVVEGNEQDIDMPEHQPQSMLVGYNASALDDSGKGD